MKIKKIEVKKLFGIFDHQIPLMNDSNITIVIGENGLGKTIILEAVNSLFNNRLEFFNTIDFESFIITYDNDIYWQIEKKIDKGDRCLFITMFDNNIRVKIEGGAKNKSDSIFKPARIIIEKNVTNKKRKNSDSRYFDELEILRYFEKERNMKAYDYDYDADLDLRQSAMLQLHMHRNRLIHFNSEIEESANKPKWLTDVFETINVKLIETQRIITAKEIGGDSYVNSVQKCSAELESLISKAVKESSDVTTRLDSSYPNRLINKLKQGTNDTFEELNNALLTLDNRRKLLSSVGLGIDSQDSDILQIDESQNGLINLLKLYIDDSHEKLNPFEALSVKLKLFQDIVNKRFKHKILQINRGKGLVFRSTVKKNIKDEFELISPAKLSSGEQNELILFYKLIFNSQRGDMILIDEPELSLHISWQNEFIADLKEVTSINEVTIIIATHSPDIINNNWGLRVELRGVE